MNVSLAAEAHRKVNLLRGSELIIIVIIIIIMYATVYVAISRA
jgi:hypothetical protein